MIPNDVDEDVEKVNMTQDMVMDIKSRPFNLLDVVRITKKNYWRATYSIILLVHFYKYYALL